jgi:hypothetical protein
VAAIIPFRNKSTFPAIRRLHENQARPAFLLASLGWQGLAARRRRCPAAAVPEAVRHDVKLLGLYVSFGPLRAGVRGTATALAITYAIPVLMAAYVAETLAKLTGAPTSWHIMGVLLAVNATAWLVHFVASKLGAAHPK